MSDKPSRPTTWPDVAALALLVALILGTVWLLTR